MVVRIKCQLSAQPTETMMFSGAAVSVVAQAAGAEAEALAAEVAGAVLAVVVMQAAAVLEGVGK